VDIAPTVTALAPAPSTAKITFNPASSIELAVGTAVAVAAAAIAEALGEHTDGGVTSKTRAQSGDSIAHLFRLHQFLIADFPDFTAMAREQGAAALWAATDGEVSPVTCALLIDSALEILARVVAAELN
jgi:hypothetical protein